MTADNYRRGSHTSRIAMRRCWPLCSGGGSAARYARYQKQSIFWSPCRCAQHVALSTWIREQPSNLSSGMSIKELPLFGTNAGCLRTYFESLTEAELARVLICKLRRHGLAYVEDVLTQLYGHSRYHRGQIAMLLRSIGAEPAATFYHGRANRYKHSPSVHLTTIAVF